MLVAHHLLLRLRQAEDDGSLRGEVVVVPFANPIGLSQHLNGYLAGRFDFGASGNFNREFPCLASRAVGGLRNRLGDDMERNVATVRAALVESAESLTPRREADRLKARLLALSVDADYVLDLHCDGQSLLHLYASARQEETALALATDLGAPLVLLEQDPGGAPFDEANAAPWWRLAEALPNVLLRQACFATTVELRGRGDVDDALAVADCEGILRFLRREGVVMDSVDRSLPALPPPRTALLEAVDVVEAPIPGLLLYHRAPGESVQQGEVLAEILDPSAANPAAARVTVTSRTSGLLFARLADRFVRRGDHICKVAGSEPLSHRQPGALLED